MRLGQEEPRTNAENAAVQFRTSPAEMTIESDEFSIMLLAVRALSCGGLQQNRPDYYGRTSMSVLLIVLHDY